MVLLFLCVAYYITYIKWLMHILHTTFREKVSFIWITFMVTIGVLWFSLIINRTNY